MGTGRNPKAINEAVEYFSETQGYETIRKFLQGAQLQGDAGDTETMDIICKLINENEEFRKQLAKVVQMFAEHEDDLSEFCQTLVTSTTEIYLIAGDMLMEVMLA